MPQDERSPMIDVRDLEVVFGHGDNAVHAVRSTTFSVAPGEAFGLVGESGSGKTTVLRAMAGLIDSWQGTIEIAGQPLGADRSRAARKMIQMVFQDPYGSLHPRHTVDHILAEPCRIHKLDRIEERIERMLGEVGLGPTFRFRYPHQLSGGQRQRVAIARALILEPTVVLLDEPTSALDVSVQAEVLNLLTDLRRRHGLTYMFVSHDLAVVAHMCDRVAVMNNGRVVELVTAQDLARQALENPYSLQLLRASEGYDRALAHELVQFE